MAAQAQETYPPIDGQGTAADSSVCMLTPEEADPPSHREETAAENVLYDVDSYEVQDEEIKQRAALEDVANHSDHRTSILGTYQTKLLDEGAADLQLMQPALKRLRCRIPQNKPPLAPSFEKRSHELQRDDKNCTDQQGTFLVGVMNDHPEITHASIKLLNEERESTINKAESEAAEEEKSELCVTPTAREQRIPESKDLVCPPAPIKKKATALKPGISRPHENRRQRSNLLISPPDLHTFPDCIRALFDK